MPKRVLIYAVVLIVLWGSSLSVATLTLGSLSRHAMLFYALLWGTACLFVVIVVTGRLRDLRNYPFRRVAQLVFTGIFGFFLYYFLLYWALSRARSVDAVPEATIINYLFPMCTLLASAALLGEKLTFRAIISAMVCFAGAYVVVCRGDLTHVRFEHPLIDLLALSAAVSWGMFSALGRKWPHEPLTGLFIFMITGLVIAGVVLVFTGGRRYPVGWEVYGAFHVGFLSNTLGCLLWFQALKHGGVSLVGNFALLTAFVSLTFIRLLLPDQTIHPTAVAGLAVIILGVALSRTARPRGAGAAGPTEPPT